MKKRTKVIFILSLVFWGLVIMGLLLFGYSFTKISFGNIALQQNIWYKNIQRTMSSGLYHRGLKSRSIIFPSTIQYITYSSTPANGPLTLISKDMQQFKMDYTLAYRILFGTLQNTYQRYQDSFVSRMRTEVNNIIMSIMSTKDSKQVWTSTTEDQIKAQIYTKVNNMATDSTKFYGAQIHGFWMSNFVFSSLEQYFQNSYINSQSSSLAYKNSIYELNSINIQKSSLESTIRAAIRAQNASFVNQFIRGYTAYDEDTTGTTPSTVATSKLSLANTIKSIADLTNINDSFLAFRNFTEVVFE